MEETLQKEGQYGLVPVLSYLVEIKDLWLYWLLPNVVKYLKSNTVNTNIITEEYESVNVSEPWRYPGLILIMRKLNIWTELERTGLL